MEFYFAYDAFEQRLALLRRLLKSSEGLILVIGDKGSGKTTLLHRFVHSAKIPWKTYRIRRRSGSRSTKGAGKSNIENHPAVVLQDGRSSIVMIDNADRLTRRDLESLLKDVGKENTSKPVKRLVLLGRPEINATFSPLVDTYFSKSAVNRIHLPGLNIEEVPHYLKHRLAVAGYAGKELFTAAVVNKIHQSSGNLPGAVNQAASRWLQRTYSGRGQGGAAAQSRWFKAILVAVAIIGCVLGLLYVVNRLLYRPDASGLKPVPPRVLVRKKITPVDSRVIRRPIETERPAVLLGSAMPQKPRLKLPGTEPSVRPPAAGQAPETPGKVSGSTTPVKVRKVHREDWLLEQNPAHYTIQIIGVSNEQTLLQFISNNPSLKEDLLAYYRTKYKGNVWFPLLHGVYATKGEASAAVKTLPEAIRKRVPWIRPLSKIQSAIGKRRNR